jgi:hypothetical protein
MKNVSYKQIISHFKQLQGLEFKKLAVETAAVGTKAMDIGSEKLMELLEGYKARDIYDAYETGFATCDVLCLEEICDVTRSQNCVERGQDDGGDEDNEAETKQVLSFMENTS